MSQYPKIEPESIDHAYYLMFQGIEEFFRYAKRHPDDTMPEYLDEAYYVGVGPVLKRRIDHEIKHLHSPYLD